MGLFLLFSLAAGSAALLGVINLFDGNSATPEASAEEIALLEGDAITATEQMLADDPTRGEDIEALDLTPFHNRIRRILCRFHIHAWGRSDRAS
ncbi:MAG: hypothetical protein P8O11_06090 [Lentibacter sp.]|uniref:hypothetical protein n=1 Tax=Lentibacter sp. TaxID=2024994 RepID=UPI00262FBD53|nr:hypothetical protein [Lentibacter sp.]MDG1289275.1 hypothetical protein [Lentibacter sp.]